MALASAPTSVFSSTFVVLQCLYFNHLQARFPTGNADKIALLQVPAICFVFCSSLTLGRSRTCLISERHSTVSAVRYQFLASISSIAYVQPHIRYDFCSSISVIPSTYSSSTPSTSQVTPLHPRSLIRTRHHDIHLETMPRPCSTHNHVPCINLKPRRRSAE